MTKLQERVNFRKSKNSVEFQERVKNEKPLQGLKKQMAFEKVMTLWIMIKNYGEKCSFRLQKLSAGSKTMKLPVGSKIKRHFAKSTTKTFWPQALKHHVDVTSHN